MYQESGGNVAVAASMISFAIRGLNTARIQQNSKTASSPTAAPGKSNNRNRHISNLRQAQQAHRCEARNSGSASCCVFTRPPHAGCFPARSQRTPRLLVFGISIQSPTSTRALFSSNIRQCTKAPLSQSGNHSTGGQCLFSAPSLSCESLRTPHIVIH